MSKSDDKSIIDEIEWSNEKKIDFLIKNKIEKHFILKEDYLKELMKLKNEINNKLMERKFFAPINFVYILVGMNTVSLFIIALFLLFLMACR